MLAKSRTLFHRCKPAAGSRALGSLRVLAHHSYDADNERIATAGEDSKLHVLAVSNKPPLWSASALPALPPPAQVCQVASHVRVCGGLRCTGEAAGCGFADICFQTDTVLATVGCVAQVACFTQPALAVLKHTVSRVQVIAVRAAQAVGHTTDQAFHALPRVRDA